MRKYRVEETGIERAEAEAQGAITKSDETCSFPKQLSNDVRAISRIDGKSFCQINEEALANYINKRKLRDGCKNNILSGPDCKCAD